MSVHGGSRQRPSSAFPSLQVATFRRFVAGQAISLVGSWIETVAQALLVLHLTHSGVILGLATAARYAPVLLLGPFAGVLVDRVSRRTLLLATQSILAALSLTLGALVISDAVTLPAVFAVAVGFGAATAVDNPARQAFVPEMVGKELLRNAVTLNSTFVNVGRAIGPLISAGLVAAVGIGWCFIANAISFVAVIAALVSIRRTDLRSGPRAPRHRGQFREGVQFARTHPEVLAPLLMMVLIGTFTYEFEVSLPLLAQTSISVGADTYSILIGAFGIGSVVGGLYCTRRRAGSHHRLLRAAALYTVSLTIAALAPTIWIAASAMIASGAASIAFLTTGNTTVQLAAPPDLHGRLTALWSTAFVGSTPIGATVIGAIGAWNARVAVLTGAAACALALLVGWAVLRQITPTRSRTAARRP